MTDAPIDFRILAGAGVTVREFKAGDVIFHQGDDAKELFVIQNGRVEILLGQSRARNAVRLRHFWRDGADRHRSAQRNGRGGQRRDACPGGREAVSVPHQPYAALRAQCLARYGAAAAGIKSHLVKRRLFGKIAWPCDRCLFSNALRVLTHLKTGNGLIVVGQIHVFFRRRRVSAPLAFDFRAQLQHVPEPFSIEFGVLGVSAIRR